MFTFAQPPFSAAWQAGQKIRPDNKITKSSKVAFKKKFFFTVLSPYAIVFFFDTLQRSA